MQDLLHITNKNLRTSQSKHKNELMSNKYFVYIVCFLLKSFNSKTTYEVNITMYVNGYNIIGTATQKFKFTSS